MLFSSLSNPQVVDQAAALAPLCLEGEGGQVHREVLQLRELRMFAFKVFSNYAILFPVKGHSDVSTGGEKN